MTHHKLLPLISPKPERNPKPPFHITAAQNEIITLLGMGNPQVGLLALLDAGMKRTPPADTLRRNLNMYSQVKQHLTPRAAVCAEYGVTSAYLNKVIRDCEALENIWGGD